MTILIKGIFCYAKILNIPITVFHFEGGIHYVKKVTGFLISETFIALMYMCMSVSLYILNQCFPLCFRHYKEKTWLTFWRHIRLFFLHVSKFIVTLSVEFYSPPQSLWEFVFTVLRPSGIF